MIVIKSPRAEIEIPTIAVLLFSVFKLITPSNMPRILAMLPQIGMIAAHKLIIPSAADAIAYILANRNSGSKLTGSKSMPTTSNKDNYAGLSLLVQFYT